jgi:hypothetical protein
MVRIVQGDAAGFVQKEAQRPAAGLALKFDKHQRQTLREAKRFGQLPYPAYSGLAAPPTTCCGFESIWAFILWLRLPWCKNKNGHKARSPGKVDLTAVGRTYSVWITSSESHLDHFHIFLRKVLLHQVRFR